jgi:NAD(P)-dependent dehydrogenase (short-subunit alcohol dehydrogenase family)
MGRVALVTVANRGISLEAARRLALRGFTTILGTRDSQKGERAARPLRQGGIKVIPVELDVTGRQSIDAVKHLVEERFGKFDALVNNAATRWRGEGQINLRRIWSAEDICK